MIFGLLSPLYVTCIIASTESSTATWACALNTQSSIKEHRTVNASLSSKALNNRYQIVKIKLITVIISNKVLFFGNTINTNKINFSDANSIRFLIGLVQMIKTRINSSMLFYFSEIVKKKFDYLEKTILVSCTIHRFSLF
jgi:hypothetical protein